jgi:hypothetical protein
MKAKATGSANHLWNFKKFSVRFSMFGQNPLIAKTILLWGRNSIMEKMGSFWHLIKFTLERSFDLPKQVFLTYR